MEIVRDGPMLHPRQTVLTMLALQRGHYAKIRAHFWNLRAPPVPFNLESHLESGVRVAPTFRKPEGLRTGSLWDTRDVTGREASETLARLMRAFVVKQHQYGMSAEWAQIPIAPGDEKSGRYAYDLEAIRQVGPRTGEHFELIEDFAAITDPHCPIHAMTTEEARRSVHIRISFNLEQARRFRAQTRDYTEDPKMRYQPFNESRRHGEDDLRRLAEAVIALEEEVLQQRAFGAATHKLYSDRNAANDRDPAYDRPLFSDIRRELEQNNGFDDQSMGAFLRIPPPPEAETDGKPRQSIGSESQRYEGEMRVDGRRIQEFSVYFTLVKCATDGTDAGQNASVHANERAGRSRKDASPIEMEYVNKQDVRNIATDLHRNSAQIAAGGDAPSVRHTFPIVLLTDSYPSGASQQMKETWARKVRRVLRRNFGWGARLDAFIRDFSAALVRGEGAEPSARPRPEDAYALALPSKTLENLSDAERAARPLEAAARFAKWPHGTEFIKDLPNLATTAGNMDGLYMLTSPVDSGSGHRLLTPEERAAPAVFAELGSLQRALWTLIAGQPIRTADIDKYLKGVVLGPVSQGEKRLSNSDLRTDDQRHIARSLQSQSETFGRLRARVDIKDDQNPRGQMTMGRCLERDLSEWRTMGVDTANERAARLWYSGTKDELWAYMHEKGNARSQNLKDTTFFQNRKDLSKDDHTRHVVAAQWHLETWPVVTADDPDASKVLTKGREQAWADTLELVCDIAGRVFMTEKDAKSFFAWRNRGKSCRVVPWLARLDAILSVFGVHSRLTGSTLYSHMVSEWKPPHHSASAGTITERGGFRRRRRRWGTGRSPRPTSR